MNARRTTRFTFQEPGHPFREGEIVILKGLPGRYRIVWTARHWVSVEEMTWWDLIVAWFRGERLS